MYSTLFKELICNHSVDVTEETFRRDLNSIYKVFHGFIPLPIIICGLVLSLIYIASVIRAIQQHKVSRKCYVLLVNRAFGDVLTCILALGIAIYTISVNIVSNEVMQILDAFIISAFWSAMFSYVSLSFIKLYAVWKPLNYRKQVTMRRCIYLGVFSWVFFAFMSAYALGVILAVIHPTLHAWTGCRRETCIRYMYKMRNAVLIVAYTVTLVCFTITVVLIQRARKFVSSFSHNSQNSAPNTDCTKKRSFKQRFPLWKLAINVGTFAIFNMFYVIWAVVLVTRTDKCFFRRRFNLMVFLLGCVRVSLLFRIVMDPIIAFITDFQIRRSFLTMFNLGSSVSPTDSNRRPFNRRSQVSDDNSSDANSNRLQRHSTRISQITDRPPIKSESDSRIEKVERFN